jgi:signal transduction histidine kinase
MIKEILDHSRKLEALDSGKASYQAVELSLNEIIENSLFVFKSQMEEKNIQFEYNFEANKDVILYGEPVSIKNQVFNNLFSNAIKFIEQGKLISISVIEVNSHLLIDFCDQGCGMAPETLKNIFRSDIKTSHKGLNGEEGTGFGMPLLHATLIELGAGISVSSVQKSEDSENHGTCFKMDFKLQQ